MKLFLFFFCAGVGLAGFASMSSLVRGETLSQSQVEKKWGQREFHEKSFREASLAERASMAASLLSKKKDFLGKKAPEIRTQLGDFSGHYFSESYPTYLIQKGSEKSPESWQLIFLIDRQDKVRDIVVHKNCCY